MDHPLFKPTDLEQAKHMSVGDCKGLSMQQRWDEETPVFAEAILSHLPQIGRGPYGINQILDYGCGPGRIAKEILLQADSANRDIVVWGADNSPEMLIQASEYVEPMSPFETTSGAFIARFSTVEPQGMAQFSQHFDLCYLVYCLQHMPAIEIRDALQRIWTFLKDDGLLFYCSSKNRMAVRFDDGGFFDDRFLGVDLIAEISRFFDYVGPAIPEELMNDAVRHMTTGEHAHPATLWRKKVIEGHLFNAMSNVPTLEVVSPKVASVGEPVIKPASQQPNITTTAGSPTKLILQNRQSPGDILVMSSAIRALHQAHPGEYLTDVRSPCTNIYENSPYITPLDENTPDVTTIDMEYPEIHFSGQSGRHFSDGHRMFLAEQIGKPIPQNGIQPDLFLSEAEKRRSLVNEISGYSGDYVVLDAGYKNDYSLKGYFFYQDVVNLLASLGIRCVQVGLQSPGHTHPVLSGTIDLLGKTDNSRDLFSVIYSADAVITPVSFPMHVAAALRKPCVVVALGREAARWEYYPDHRYLSVNGTLPCCSYDGCWKNTITDCVDLVDVIPHGSYENRVSHKVPHCQMLVTPPMIVDALMMYYEGGMVRPVEQSLKNTVERGLNTPSNENILLVLQHLKEHNPGDPYLENYQGHIAKWGDKFFDIYHFIWEWFGEHVPKRILEIGTWTGNSLGQMLRAHPDPESIEVLITCDLFDVAETSPQIVRENMRYLGVSGQVNGRIEFLVGPSQKAMTSSLWGKGKFDFILVDGAHYPPELPRQDLDNCGPLVAKGGVIVMDDLAPDGMSLDAVWQAWKADQDENWDFYENYDGKGFGYAIRR